MTVRISRVDHTVPLPAYQTAGSVAFDLSPRVDATIAVGATTILPANVIVEVPEGHALIVAARSSLAKRGLVLANGIGVVDQDYRGPNDELGLHLKNVSDQPVTLRRGERLAQGLIVPITRVTWEEMPLREVAAPNRGGFGSTGP